ncbi:5-(carboxyamino)imidazole ribonucleotide synthase [Candidatus Phycosocius spiralis]|uniref:N5-carboxyaminoimidazole ribonucleotide synthase n=1 Tax=Candidatus Phycosocius spiralis TaxID=2815099 RepID=A0ABQ4PTR6_9PROT|nr:5-(carboxyamino)imidazole ribonucleotide synthase [Candidatus Phycosocius spiralis]GIU66412.1 N5-carboxyaminoimidazole ribonucleotide synthase [Candidatus Phycosocius spiralis]
MTDPLLQLKPGSRIGILGGGQLGRLLALSAAELGFDCVVYEPEQDCPAGRVGARCFQAAWDDWESLAAFAQSVDVITFEFENVPAAALAFLAEKKPIRPGLRSLQLTQDRLFEKQFLHSLGLKTAPFAAVDHLDGLNHAVAQIGTPAILKVRTLGYDGKGQVRLCTLEDSAAAWFKLKGQACVLEGIVPFEREVSVIVARGGDGRLAHFDVTENVHQDGILRTSSVPARISTSVETAAVAAATQISHALDHIGVLAVEFFVLADGGLIVNEIAPRVHNSGHWTQDGCAASQFQQHIRAIAHWPLATTQRLSAQVIMTNLIGYDVDAWPQLSQKENGYLHLYGKRQVREGRKMGHITELYGFGEGP